MNVVYNLLAALTIAFCQPYLHAASMKITSRQQATCDNIPHGIKEESFVARISCARRAMAGGDSAKAYELMAPIYTHAKMSKSNTAQDSRDKLGAIVSGRLGGASGGAPTAAQDLIKKYGALDVYTAITVADGYDPVSGKKSDTATRYALPIALSQEVAKILLPKGSSVQEQQSSSQGLLQEPIAEFTPEPTQEPAKGELIQEQQEQQQQVSILPAAVNQPEVVPVEEVQPKEPHINLDEYNRRIATFIADSSKRIDEIILVIEQKIRSFAQLPFADLKKEDAIKEGIAVLAAELSGIADKVDQEKNGIVILLRKLDSSKTATLSVSKRGLDELANKLKSIKYKEILESLEKINEKLVDLKKKIEDQSITTEKRQKFEQDQINLEKEREKILNVLVRMGKTPVATTVKPKRAGIFRPNPALSAPAASSQPQETPAQQLQKELEKLKSQLDPINRRIQILDPMQNRPQKETDELTKLEINQRDLQEQIHQLEDKLGKLQKTST